MDYKQVSYAVVDGLMLTLQHRHERAMSLLTEEEATEKEEERGEKDWREEGFRLVSEGWEEEDGREKEDHALAFRKAEGKEEAAVVLLDQLLLAVERVVGPKHACLQGLLIGR